MKQLISSIIFSVLTLSYVANADSDLEFLNQVIHSDKLSGYWHVDSFPDRSPLVVDIPLSLEAGSAKFEKFGKPVIVAHNLPKGSVAIFIDKIREENMKMEVDFSYPPEGLRGVAIFHEVKGKWLLEKLEIFES